MKGVILAVKQGGRPFWEERVVEAENAWKAWSGRIDPLGR